MAEPSAINASEKHPQYEQQHLISSTQRTTLLHRSTEESYQQKLAPILRHHRGRVALRLLQTKLYARAFLDQPVRPGQFAPELLRLLAARVGRPRGGWTQRTVWRGIARCGGFLARQGDGEPGWITIWRGWRSLLTMVEGVVLYRTIRGKKCG